jgi:hypothetical protein
MFSVKADRVLDPFMGTGTTMAAAMAAGRCSVGYETDTHLVSAIHRAARSVTLPTDPPSARRLVQHQNFVEQHSAAGKFLKHINEPYGFPVVTRQEKFLQLHVPANLVRIDETRFELSHEMAQVPFKYSLFDN